MFCVDNDPDQSPPCRMVHVVEGGDYGFRFCYGRSGKHPFQSWHGELPGTLPMMTGVGEAPCEILSYESDGLPPEYRGQLLVTSWADHRVERYAVKPHGASFKAERLPFVQGGNNFRPAGLCVAPDGSLYVTDWVLPNYNLHGKGAIWHIRWKDAPKPARPTESKEALFSLHRPLREAAARKLTGIKNGPYVLTKQLGGGDARIMASAFTALLDVNDPHLRSDVLSGFAESKVNIGIREMAVRALVNSRSDVKRYVSQKFAPSIRAEAMPYSEEIDLMVEAMAGDDPFLRHAAIMGMAKAKIAGDIFGGNAIKNVSVRQSAFLTLSRMPALKNPEAGRWIDLFLRDPDETVRFLAVKWIADEKLADYRKDIEKALADPKLSVRMYTAYATALARLDGRDVNEKSLADYFAKRLADDATPPALRAMLLRQVPATHPKLTIDLLAKFVNSDDAALKFEAVRALVEHPSSKRHGPLLDVFRNPKLGTNLQAFALLGLTDRKPEELVPEILPLATNPKSPLQADAERALIGVELKPGQPFTRRRKKDARPPRTSTPGSSGSKARPMSRPEPRVFFHPKLGGCYKCHRVDGRGPMSGRTSATSAAPTADTFSNRFCSRRTTSRRTM